MKTQANVWLAALAFWIVASVLACWLYPVAIPDVCARYAVMADAFAQGDWYNVYHPRFGVLFSTLAGAFSWATGLAGIYTVQIAAFLLLALAAGVAFAFARELTGSSAIGWWTFALVLLAPDYFVDALDGLRESAHCLVFALLGLGVVTRRSRYVALALFLYVIGFTYGFVASSVMLGVWCLWTLCERDVRKWWLPIAGWGAGAAIACVMVHAYTGYWVPVPQFIGFLGGAA